LNKTWQFHTSRKETFWRGGKYLLPKYVVIDYDKAYHDWHLAPAGFVNPELEKLRMFRFKTKKEAARFFRGWMKRKKLKEVV
jgi:hypothetical protein